MMVASLLGQFLILGIFLIAILFACVKICLLIVTYPRRFLEREAPDAELDSALEELDSKLRNEERRLDPWEFDSGERFDRISFKDD